MKFTTQHVLYQQHLRIRVVNFIAKKISIQSLCIEDPSKLNTHLSTRSQHLPPVPSRFADTNTSKQSIRSTGGWAVQGPGWAHSHWVG